MAESTDDTIEVTFVWGADCDPHGGKRLTLHMLKSELEMRDPDGKSTIAAKMRFTKSLAFEMAPTGPGDDEYMCAQACSLEYISLASGNSSTQCARFCLRAGPRRSLSTCGGT